MKYQIPGSNLSFDGDDCWRHNFSSCVSGVIIDFRSLVVGSSGYIGRRLDARSETISEPQRIRVISLRNESFQFDAPTEFSKFFIQPIFLVRLH